jgi:polysaccharide export outer membrane protein
MLIRKVKSARTTDLTALLLPAALVGLSGCAKSFMDPSKLSRHQPTPTIMPILDRIASIEEDSGDVVEYSDTLPEDLIPQPQSYRVGPGDVLEVTAWDIVTVGEKEVYNVAVDARGMVEIPQLGRIFVAGRTTEDAQEAVKDVIRSKNIIEREPLVQVIAVSQRQQTFTIIGAVQNPGLYPIPRADYRLLEALSAAGNFDETMQYVYVIRQIPLSEEIAGSLLAPDTGDSDSRGPSLAPGASKGLQGQPSTRDIENIINDVLEKDAPKPDPMPPADILDEAPAKPTGGMGALAPLGMAERRQDPVQPAVPDVVTQGSQILDPEGTRPTPDNPASSWIYVNGQWMKIRSATGGNGFSTDKRAEQLITQRVVRVPMKDLLAGKQSINMIVRPGDVVRFPAAASGVIYIGGEIARPGVYNVTPGLTLLRGITAAGGLSEIAIPERVDLTRMIGSDRQATIRLDVNAIAMQTQPDIFLKPGDQINIGTNFWALPVAVIRNGFRASYGFGFILDRNFSNDIFGPPPVNQFGQ